MFELKNISKNFGPHRVLKDISFKIPKGKITGLLGPNGAGKTTTIRIITGILAADRGAIFFHNQLINPLDWHSRFQLGYLPEDNPLYDFLTPYEYLQFIGEMRQATTLEQQIAWLAKKLFFDDRLHDLIGHLSKGYRQRVGLAASFLGTPSLIILDEPLNGLDPNQQQKVRQFLRQSRSTILFSSHILSEVQAICQHVVIIHQGEIITAGDINNLLQKSSLIIQIKNTTPSVLQNILAKAKIKIARQKKKGQIFTIELTSNQPLDKAQLSLWRIIRQHPRWQVLQLKTKHQSLKSIFQKLTQ